MRRTKERLEHQLESQRATLPVVHQSIIDREEKRLAGAKADLEEGQATLKAERERFVDEMEAWRRKMEEDHKQTWLRVRYSHTSGVSCCYATLVHLLARSILVAVLCKHLTP